MIRDMESEKKTLNRRHDGGFSGYLSDEALDKLIAQVEKEEMLHAPKYLKDDIMAQIGHKKRSAKNRQLFVYRAKVLVAMAAALTILILMPDDRTENMNGMWSVQQTQEESIEQLALKRQENMDAEWKKYLEARASGGVRGFLSNINEKVTAFGESLYDSIGRE